MKPLKPITRRQFLGHTSVASATLAAAVNTLGNPLSTTPASAAEPLKRIGTHRFKFSLAAYSYRNLLSGKKPAMTMQGFVDDCARLNLDGTELTSYYFPNPLSDDYLRDLKRHCFEQGLDISGTAVGNDFCHPPGKQRAAQIAAVKRWIDHAELLGAPVIRIFSGNVKQGQTPQQSHKLAVEGMEECCQYAGEHGVMLALENHGGLTANVDSMLQLVRDVKSRWLGVNMDTGNFHSADVYGDLAKLAPYSVNVQVKVTIRPAGGKKQPSDFRRLAKILRTAGYRGYVVLEYEEKGDPRTECKRYMTELREAFA